MYVLVIFKQGIVNLKPVVYFHASTMNLTLTIMSLVGLLSLIVVMVNISNE